MFIIFYWSHLHGDSFTLHTQTKASQGLTILCLFQNPHYQSHEIWTGQKILLINIFVFISDFSELKCNPENSNCCMESWDLSHVRWKFLHFSWIPYHSSDIWNLWRKWEIPTSVDYFQYLPLVSHVWSYVIWIKTENSPPVHEVLVMLTDSSQWNPVHGSLVKCTEMAPR